MDSSIGNNWNVDGFFNFLNYFPIASPYSFFVLLLCSAMDGEERAACIYDSIDNIKSFFFSFSNSDFAKNWNFNIVYKGSDNLFN